ncbi:MAG: hypothetical protein WCS84_12695 [Nocardioides sp.]|jgi:hypothetical protein
MTLPLWVPWLLALSLALPVALRRGSGTPTPRAGLVAMLLPALVMTWFAASLTLDRRQVSQEELDTAARDAAAALDGSLGPVNVERVAGLMAADLGKEIWVESSDLSVQNELNASYTIEARVSVGETEPAACLEVSLELLSEDAPDLRLANVEARSGPCD